MLVEASGPPRHELATPEAAVFVGEVPKIAAMYRTIRAEPVIRRLAFAHLGDALSSGAVVVDEDTSSRNDSGWIDSDAVANKAEDLPRPGFLHVRCDATRDPP